MTRPAAVAYADVLGDPGNATVYRQAHGCGIPIITHRHLDPAGHPHDRVEVVERRATLTDRMVAGLRWLRERHPYRLPVTVEEVVADRICECGATTIHAFGGAAGLRIAPIARRLDCRLLVTLGRRDVESLAEEDGRYRRALPGLFVTADRILALSRHVADRARELGCPRESIEVVPTGIALHPLPHRSIRPDEPVRVVVAARLQPARRVPALVEAVGLARRMGADVELDIIGDGPDRLDVERRVAQSGLGELARVHGALGGPQRRRLLDRGDVFLWGGHGGARCAEGGPCRELLEAMTSGLCVIATRDDGIEEIVSHEVNGLVVEREDTAILAGALGRAANDAALRLALGAAGRARVERDFDAARSIHRLLSLYGARATEPV